MASPRVVARPDDPRLRYSGYVRRVEVSATRARFDRVYGSLPLAAHGPATASRAAPPELAVVDGVAVSVAVEYTSACSERCCPASTSRATAVKAAPSAGCMQVDGARPRRSAAPAAGFERGVHHLELPPGDGQPHEYTLLWPWAWRSTCSA